MLISQCFSETGWGWWICIWCGGNCSLCPLVSLGSLLVSCLCLWFLSGKHSPGAGKGHPWSGWAREAVLSMMPRKGRSTICWWWAREPGFEGHRGPWWWSLCEVCASPMLTASPEGHLQTPGEGARPWGSLPYSALLFCASRLTGSPFADTSTPCLSCCWMLQQYLIKSRSFF